MTVELRRLQVGQLEPWFFSAAWHQAMYIAAAHRQHWATRPGVDDDRMDTERHEKLLEADAICRRLLLVAVSTLEATHAGTSEVKAFLPAKADQIALLKFLDDIVEASAAVLLAGIRLELDMSFEPAGEKKLFPLPRRQLVHELVEEEALNRRSVSPGWLVSYADASSNAGRVEYNLACFYSSLAWKKRRDLDEQALNKLLSDSASHLRFALDRLDYAELQVLVPWINDDPSLRGLRELDSELFESVTRPLSRVSAPRQKVKESKPWWRRLLRWRR